MTTKTTGSTSTTHTAGPSPAPREARQRAGGGGETFLKEQIMKTRRLKKWRRSKRSFVSSMCAARPPFQRGELVNLMRLKLAGIDPRRRGGGL